MRKEDLVRADLERMSSLGNKVNIQIKDALESFFEDQQTREVDITDWNRERQQLDEELWTLARPLRDVLNQLVHSELSTNVNRIVTKFPQALLTSPVSQSYISAVTPDSMRKIGKRFLRGMVFHQPQILVADNPEEDILFREPNKDSTLVALVPGIKLLLPFAITKLGNELQDPPIKATIIYTRHYTLRQTQDGTGLQPQLKGNTYLIYEQPSFPAKIFENDEKRMLRAHLREAWAMNHPYEGGAFGQGQ